MENLLEILFFSLSSFIDFILSILFFLDATTLNTLHEDSSRGKISFGITRRI